ncbi:MAG: DNA-binding transcriptional regulator, LysR family [Modestobacter sp.]|jgi:DNA-binding transcriptional LysR family regulator|nr:DNA-binding transcriptional regulator, LysR family [Modestobacter sp.]
MGSMAPSEYALFVRGALLSDSPAVELRQFEHFLAVVEEGSFTRAAARVFMVQSSLSASLLGLERELGTELFIRGRSGAELTDAGRAFLEPARAALAEADRARDAVAEVKGLLRGSVRIAVVAVPRSVDVVETIRRFRDEHPGVDVHVVPVCARDMTDLVAEGQVDFAITPRTHRTNSALRFEPLVSSPLVVICPAGHRLAGAADVPPAEVVEELIIDLPRGWRVRELFDDLMDEAGLQRRVGLEINDWLAVLTMVQRGMGISYGPRECIDVEMFSGIAIATMAGAPSWELGIVSRDEPLRGAAGRAFLAAYLEQCRSRRTD